MIKEYFDIFNLAVALVEYTKLLRFVNQTFVVGVNENLKFKGKIYFEDDFKEEECLW